MLETLDEISQRTSRGRASHAYEAWTAYLIARLQGELAALTAAVETFITEAKEAKAERTQLGS